MTKLTILAVLALASSLVSTLPVLAADPLGDDSGPGAKPQVIVPKQYQPRVAASPTPAPSPGFADVGSTVYFTPQDENTSTTVLFLFNTTDTDATVALASYYLNGSPTISTTLNVPAHNLVRICADSVSTVSASWAGYVLVNFTTFSAYAKLTLPPGVKVDGYVAWNTSGIYDPLAELQTLPLAFH